MTINTALLTALAVLLAAHAAHATDYAAATVFTAIAVGYVLIEWAEYRADIESAQKKQVVSRE